jgi:hypothetical protein
MKVWYLRDALEDTMQRQHISRHLNEADWKFLSERSSVVTERGGNTATFFKIPRLGSNPDAAIDNDSGDNDCNIRSTSLQDESSLKAEFTARVREVLNGLSVAEFSQLPDSQRRSTLNHLLVAPKPIWIWDEGYPQDTDDSIAEDATLLVQVEWTGDDTASLEAQEVYYGGNSFRLQLLYLADFLHAHEPGAKDFAKRLIIMISATPDGLDMGGPEDLLQLLECKQIQQVTLEIKGHDISELDLAMSNFRPVIGQLRGKFGSGLRVLRKRD